MIDQTLIRALVFDFDGTLVDSDPIKRSAFYHVTAAVPGASDALDALFARPDPGDRYGIFVTLAAGLGLNCAEDWTEAYGRHCERHILGLLAGSDVGHVLEGLKADGYGLFVASATPQSDLVSMVEKSPLAGFFRGVYGRPDAKPEILRNILCGNDWGPREIVMIGNDEPDRRAAEEIGCPFIGIGRDGSPFDGPIDALIADIGGLTEADIIPTIERPPGAAG